MLKSFSRIYSCYGLPVQEWSGYQITKSFLVQKNDIYSYLKNNCGADGNILIYNALNPKSIYNGIYDFTINKYTSKDEIIVSIYHTEISVPKFTLRVPKTSFINNKNKIFRTVDDEYISVTYKNKNNNRQYHYHSVYYNSVFKRHHIYGLNSSFNFESLQNDNYVFANL